MSSGNGVSTKLKEQVETQRGKLIISRRIFDLISQMHVASVGKEWSGIPIYSVNGSYADVENLSIEILDIVPMNIGSATYTEFNFNLAEDKYLGEKLAWAMDNNLPYGCIHSHNSMTTFFSGTDTDDLHENSEKMDAYLSVIVNYKHNLSDWCAKVGIFGEENIEGFVTTKNNVTRRSKYNTSTTWIEDFNNEESVKPITITNKFIKVINFDLVRGEGDWSDVDRAIEIQGKQNKAIYQNTAAHNYGGNYGGYTHANTYSGLTSKTKTGQVDPKVVAELKTSGRKGGMFKVSKLRGFIAYMAELFLDCKMDDDKSNVYSSKDMANAITAWEKIDEIQKIKLGKVISSYNEWTKLIEYFFDIDKVTVKEVALLEYLLIEQLNDECINSVATKFLLISFDKHFSNYYLLDFTTFNFHSQLDRNEYQNYTKTFEYIEYEV